MRKSLFVRVCPWFLFLVFSGFGNAQDAVIHLKNGGTVEARIVELDESGLSFRSGAATQAARMSYDQIARLDLPPPDEWTRAMQFFEFGLFADAAPIFEKIAGVRTRVTGYPAPGNFTSLSQRRLLDCLRRLGDSAGVAKLLGELEPGKLPEEEREIPVVLHAWASAGSGDWSRVIEIAETAQAAAGFSNASEQGIEMGYLKGLALKATGQPEEAVLSFATAYALNAATDVRISRLALQEAAELIGQNEERQTEFRAQVHLYSSVFGKGGLWEGADENATRVLGEILEIGEAALGQAGRTATDGEFMKESFGLDTAEQVTADHMKKVGLGRKAAGAKKKE